MYSFDAERVTKDLIQWIKDWFNENGPECNAVIGISGGKDSSVVAALCKEALGSNRVFGVTLPNGKQSDINDSMELIDYLGINSADIDIRAVVDLMRIDIAKAVKLSKVSERTRQNLPPRVRMAYLYGIAQSYDGFVSCNTNLSEYYLGYGTRWGDTVGDFAPLLDLTVSEVIQIGRVLQLPERLVSKAPSDGLCGKTDEDNFGFKYSTLDLYIREGVISDDEILQKITARFDASRFKRLPISKFKYREVA